MNGFKRNRRQPITQSMLTLKAPRQVSVTYWGHTRKYSIAFWVFRFPSVFLVFWLQCHILKFVLIFNTLNCYMVATHCFFYQWPVTIYFLHIIPWWRHQMETFCALLAFVWVFSPHKGQWRGALMFSLICALNKRLSKQSRGGWFETLSCTLWRHCNANKLVIRSHIHISHWCPIE